MVNQTLWQPANSSDGRTRTPGLRRRPQRYSIHPILWIALGSLILVSLGISSCALTPIIYQPIVPSAVAPGGASFTMTINGDQFTTGSTINWNGTPLTPVTTTTSTQITGTVPASLIAKPGTATITVLSGSGGGTSNVIYFPVWNVATSASFVTASGSPIMVGVTPSAVVVADFNADGKADLAVANAKDGTVTILLGNGDGTFTPASGSPITVGAGPDALAVGDFNVNDIPDLVVANGKAGTVTVLIGKGDGTLKATAASPITVGTNPDAVAVGDFNGNGEPGIVVANGGSNNIMYLQGNGDGTFKGPVSTAVGSAPSALAIGDFIGNYSASTPTLSGNLSVAVANAGSNNVTVLIGGGNGTFAPASGSPIAVGTAPSALAVADLNGDGMFDLAVANSGSNNVTVLLGNGSGGFTPASGSPVSVGTSPSSVAIADFNADNKLDLAVANSGDSTLSVLLGAGTGSFTAIPTLPATGVGPVSLAVADFNGDGRLDLATADTTDNTAYVLLQPIAVAPSVSSLTYDQQGLNTTSPAQSVTISNNTPAAVSLTAINITGTDSADFAAPHPARRVQLRRRFLLAAAPARSPAMVTSKVGMRRFWKFLSEINQRKIPQTSVTSIPACFNARKSDFAAPRSVITSFNAEGRRDQRKTAPPELARVAHCHGTFRDLHHNAIHFRFQQVGRAQPVGARRSRRRRGNRMSALKRRRSLPQSAHQGKRILAQRAARQDYFHRRARQFRRDIDRVGDNRQILELPQRTGDRGRSRGRSPESQPGPLSLSARRRRRCATFPDDGAFPFPAAWDLPALPRATAALLRACGGPIHARAGFQDPCES